jgi:hypothetical protein
MNASRPIPKFKHDLGNLKESPEPSAAQRDRAILLLKTAPYFILASYSPSVVS